MAELLRTYVPLLDVKVTSDDGPGTFEGYASTFGNVDRVGDVITRGAFEPVLASFLSDGFIALSHDWWGLPVATPKTAYEDERGLFFTAEFHTTQHAQDTRAVMVERLARGKSVGLSIGYLPDWENGVSVRDDGVRVITRMAELPEVSFTVMPANRLAGATAVKAATGASLDFADHLDLVLREMTDLQRRARERATFRLKEGRTLSTANRDRLASNRDALRAIADDLDELLEATAPADKSTGVGIDVVIADTLATLASCGVPLEVTHGHLTTAPRAGRTGRS